MLIFCYCVQSRQQQRLRAWLLYYCICRHMFATMQWRQNRSLLQHNSIRLIAHGARVPCVCCGGIAAIYVIPSNAWLVAFLHYFMLFVRRCLQHTQVHFVACSCAIDSVGCRLADSIGCVSVSFATGTQSCMAFVSMPNSRPVTKHLLCGKASVHERLRYG